MMGVLDRNELEMRRLMTHPDELVVSAVSEALQLAGFTSWILRSQSTDQAQGQRLQSLMDAFLERLTPLLSHGSPAWSPLLDRVGIAVPHDQYQSPMMAFRPAQVDLTGRVSAALKGLDPDGDPMSLIHSFHSVEWRKAVVMQSTTMSTEMMAYALAQEFVTSIDLIAHQGISPDGVRFLVRRASMELTRGQTTRFTEFMSTFYTQGHSLSMEDLMHLKLDYLAQGRTRGFANAMSGVRELVADPELGESLLKAITPQGFASLLAPLTGEIWGSAMMYECTRSLEESRGTKHLIAALERVTPDQVRAAPKSVIRSLLTSADKDVRLLATRIVSNWDATSATEVVSGQNFLAGQHVALPAFRRAPRGR